MIARKIRPTIAQYARGKYSLSATDIARLIELADTPERMLAARFARWHYHRNWRLSAGR